MKLRNRTADIRHPRTLLIAIMVVIAALGLGSVLRQASTEKYRGSAVTSGVHPYSQWPMVITPRPSVLFSGDDFAAGYGGVGLNAYPYILCNSIGLSCHVDAQTGTGLINDGRRYSAGTLRLIDRLPVDARLYDVDIVVVDAGRNDAEATAVEYSTALESYAQQVKRIWPKARIVVILPAYLSVEADSKYHGRAVAAANAVVSFGGDVIDPVARGWYAGVDLSSLQSGGDGHPNQKGHELIARKLAEDFAALGVTPTEEVG